ncbi:hypothetical protein ES703_50187 [subsurface metagenome]
MGERGRLVGRCAGQLEVAAGQTAKEPGTIEVG